MPGRGGQAGWKRKCIVLCAARNFSALKYEPISAAGGGDRDESGDCGRKRGRGDGAIALLGGRGYLSSFPNAGQYGGGGIGREVYKSIRIRGPPGLKSRRPPKLAVILASFSALLCVSFSTPKMPRQNSNKRSPICANTDGI